MSDYRSGCAIVTLGFVKEQVPVLCRENAGKSLGHAGSYFFTNPKRVIAVLVVLPFWVLTGYTKYVFVSQMISMIPLHFGEIVRCESYRRTLAACGEDVTIGFGSYISYPDVMIGNHVWMDVFCNVGRGDIGDFALVARMIHIVSGGRSHPFGRTDILIMQQQGEFGWVRVGPDVWIGSGVIVLADIGPGCVAGAGSVVVRSVPPLCIATGNPARVIQQRGDVSDPIDGLRKAMEPQT